MAPLIGPAPRKYTAVELRTVLRVVHQADFRNRLQVAVEAAGEKWKLEGGQPEARFHTVFHVVLAAVAFQACNSLVSTAQFDCERFCAFEEVAVGESGCNGSTEVAVSVRAVSLCTNAVVGVALQEDVGVKFRDAVFRVGHKMDGRVIDSGQAVQTRISVLHVLLAV